MKIKESYWHEASKADKNDKSNWTSDARRQSPAEHSDAASKLRQNASPLKDETKFAAVLESPAKLQKPNQQREDSGGERRDDQKKEKKDAAREKDSADNLTGDGKTEKRESSGGQAGGGQSGFGTGGNVNQLNLGNNLAARSILHIADLERLISTVRTQIGLGGRREIVLQLKRSVLEGLQVKIITDPAARVQIEFLAASEKARSQIESHSQELSEILRGRGINIQSLTTSLDSGKENRQFSNEKNSDIPEIGASLNSFDSSADNTFVTPADDDKNYKA